MCIIIVLREPKIKSFTPIHTHSYAGCIHQWHLTLFVNTN